jgi:hypothetical protein
MDNNINLLNEDSNRIEDIENINIKLKGHQLAMIHKCIEIENFNLCSYGIMSDKPGTGKTFAILGFIYAMKLGKEDNILIDLSKVMGSYERLRSTNNINIIVVPQNIIFQWTDSIHRFSDGKLTYKKFIDYSDILELYNPSHNLFDYDILITTSLYYNVIATSISSNNYIVERVFFDEIDSISSVIINQINCRFSWFISASFDHDLMGIYSKKVDNNLLNYITCKCEDEFIDNMFNIPDANIYKIICKNIYFDNIFAGLFSKDEYRLLNAHDYSKLKRKFHNKIAQNEKEAVDFIVKDKMDIIEMEELRIDDLTKSITVCSNGERKNELIKQLEESKKSFEENTNKLNLIKERLKENNCCPLCYEEFQECDKKVISQCCKNTICYNCTDNWFNILKKTNCIYCNKAEITLDSYVIVKPENVMTCTVCDVEFINNDSKLYSICCKKNVCILCLKDWYQKLLNISCLFCKKNDIGLDDFKNEQQFEEMRLNELSGIKYIRKTKIEFLEYFIKTKIYGNGKIIFCSNYIRIFNDIKKLFEKHSINYLELDDGNLEMIENSVKEYTYGNIKVVLLNSNLFGCGLNLECTTDIVFLHKTISTLEKQIIGRAQRPGRKDALNIWHIMHENETIAPIIKKNLF